ncbi:Glu/Leu/Phe/Val dehydrogenase dimerization domain-containing protein [Egicoccus halophilus]|uniref:Glutamate dehydrogenase n=1 Tax=Egicoccus halophilus TaxID=1670830 RepID=A0A8J3A8W9_9ACTN|nr:Glu/Leu/Phe/Val dehydrogenase dimerization domain-containing protein [Egicoccus halophilus]GGI07011.1 glutamate dehydrogenase [Egicoccus halophilus]
MTVPPLLEITWRDPVTGTPGYVVIDRLVRGLASGGLRVRAGCDLEEVAGLARGMSRKEAIVYDPADRYLPLGGAKGGLDLDPASPDAEAVLHRFLGAIKPVVEQQWTTGEDFGVRQETLDRIAHRIGLRSTVEAVFARLDDAEAARDRLARAFAVEVDGVGLGDLVGGYGVAEAAVAHAELRGRDPARLTAVVQGFGSIGGATARYLARAGVRVVGVVDRAGLLVDEDGLDVEALLRVRDASGVVDRDRVGALAQRDGTDWYRLDADLLVPAAMSYVLDVDQVDDVRAGVVAEGANLPTLPAAEERLRDRGVEVLPDFLTNLATNAWWWWVVYGDVEPTAEASFAKTSATMRRLVKAVVADADARQVSLREAALDLADRNVALLADHFGSPT